MKRSRSRGPPSTGNRARTVGSGVVSSQRTPHELGGGERLWNSPEELLDRSHLEKIPSPSGVVHHFFWRR